MDEIGNKALVIAVGLFVALGIIGYIVVAFTTSKQIFGVFDQQTRSAVEIFSDEFAKFDSTDLIGMDVINALKKYDSNDKVIIVINGTIYTTNAEKENAWQALKNASPQASIKMKKYKATYTQEGVKTTINFSGGH